MPVKLYCMVYIILLYYMYKFTDLTTEQNSCLKKIEALDEAEQKVRVKSAGVLKVSWS